MERRRITKSDITKLLLTTTKVITSDSRLYYSSEARDFKKAVEAVIVAITPNCRCEYLQADHIAEALVEVMREAIGSSATIESGLRGEIALAGTTEVLLDGLYCRNGDPKEFDTQVFFIRTRMKRYSGRL